MDLEALQRQVDELDALASLYPPGCGGGGGGGGCREGLILEASEHAALELARRLLLQPAAAAPSGSGDAAVAAAAVAADEAAAVVAAAAAALPPLSGAVRPGLLLGRQPVALRFSLPPGYPLSPHCVPALAIECSAPRRLHERLDGTVRAAVGAAGGEECLLLAVDALREAVEAAAGAEAEHAPQSASATTTITAAAGCSGGAGGSGEQAAGAQQAKQQQAQQAQQALLCVAVWFHHIKSPAKRKTIVAWARELDLAGACKPGFPGVVVAEGRSPDVRDFLERVRGLRWQAMQVRCEDELPYPSCSGGGGSGGSGPGPPPSAPPPPPAPDPAPPPPPPRRLRGGFVELDEGGMAALGALCREAGLAHVLGAVLKL